MSLTSGEKAAGRSFRERKQDQLDRYCRRNPAGASCTSYISFYHHSCPSQGGANTGLTLHERYETSPGYRVMPGGFAREISPDEVAVTAISVVLAGTFAFIWKEGSCTECGLTVRSPKGRLVIAAARPPRERPHHERQAGARPGDS